MTTNEIRKFVSIVISVSIFCLIPFTFSFAQVATGCKIPQNPPIYSEIIPTKFVPRNPGPNDWKERFVAPNGKTVTVLVQAPQGTGTYSRAMRSDETPDTYFPAVVSEAIAAGDHKLVIPKGVYDFLGTQTGYVGQSGPAGSCNAGALNNCNASWTIGNYPGHGATLQDLEIDGSGSTLNFSVPVAGIQFFNVLRFQLHNFIVDWPETPMSALGTIVADPTNSPHHGVVIDDSFPVTAMPSQYTSYGYPQIAAVNRWAGETQNDLGHFISLNTPPAGGSQINAMYFVFSQGANGLPIYPSYVGKTSAGNQTFSCSNCLFLKGQGSWNANNCNYVNGSCVNLDYFAIGTRVVVRYFLDQYAIGVTFSNDVDLDHITIYKSPGFAVGSGNGGDRGFRIANTTVTRRPGVPVSAAADGFNGGQYDTIFENNEVAYNGDDAINLWSGSANVTSIVSLSQSGGTVQAPCPGDYVADPSEYVVRGDRVAFFDQDQDYLDSVQITSASCVSNQFTFGKCASGNCAQSLGGLNNTSVYTNLTKGASARFWVNGENDHDSAGAGFRTAAPFGMVTNSRFSENATYGIFFDAGGGNGMGPSNVVVQRNTLRKAGANSDVYGAFWIFDITPGYQPWSSSVIQKLELFGNTITQNPGPGLFMSSAGNICMSRNTIVNSNMVKRNPTKYNHLSTLDSVLIFDTTNGTLCATSVSGTSGPIGLDPSNSNVNIFPSCP